MSPPDGLPNVSDVRIKEQKTFNGQVFPLVLSPDDASKSLTCADWCAWVDRNKEQLKKVLMKYGAIYFRNFNVDSPEDFDAFVKSFHYDVFPYVGGAAPRNQITGNVFSANESPPEDPIPFHHEISQSPIYPKVLFFFGDVIPKSGGQTSIALSNAIYNAMRECEPKFVEKLEKEGVCYTRVLPDGDDNTSTIGRGWQNTYLTNDKKEAEKAAEKRGTKFEWLPDGSMKTMTNRTAIQVEERTKQKTWFNSIVGAYTTWQDSRNDRKKAITFQNGEQMNEEIIKTLENVFEQMAVDITWQHGDVMMVDNRLALHGRRPGTAPRRILAALCDE